MTQKSKTIVETEWSHFWDSEYFKGNRESLSISPDAPAALRLAQRLNLLNLDSLQADIKITRNPGEIAFHVEGQIKADITQACVVSLEPVSSHIEDEFEAWFADPEAAISIAKARHERLNEKGHGELPILDEREDPEALIDGRIDLGELVTQYLSLSINPYPHAEGVEFEEKTIGVDMEKNETLKNPFAALQAWKDKMTGGEEP